MPDDISPHLNFDFNRPWEEVLDPDSVSPSYVLEWDGDDAFLEPPTEQPQTPEQRIAAARASLRTLHLIYQRGRCDERLFVTLPPHVQHVIRHESERIKFLSWPVYDELLQGQRPAGRPGALLKPPISKYEYRVSFHMEQYSLDAEGEMWLKRLISTPMFHLIGHRDTTGRVPDEMRLQVQDPRFGAYQILVARSVGFLWPQQPEFILDIHRMSESLPEEWKEISVGTVLGTMESFMVSKFKRYIFGRLWKKLGYGAVKDCPFVNYV
jgi:hypothetical protein